jgi:hypothetical protein
VTDARQGRSDDQLPAALGTTMDAHDARQGFQQYFLGSYA